LSAITVAVVSFTLIVLSVLGGVALRSRLPADSFTGDSKDVIRLATALIGTMAAVVLALLFASTRASYETTNSRVAHLTAGMIELDQLLREYGGDDGVALRQALRDELPVMISSIWRDNAPLTAKVVSPKAHQETAFYKLRALSPQAPVQASLKARALIVSNDLEESRLSLFAQPDDSLSKPFITVLVLWLCFIFASFSMSSKANATLLTVLLTCAFTASTAIYLILELGQPFDGLLQISNTALRNALLPLS
jgi:hypothetical protein